MTLEVLATLMLVAFFVLLLIGIPVGLTLAATGFVFGRVNDSFPPNAFEATGLPDGLGVMIAVMARSRSPMSTARIWWRIWFLCALTATGW